MVNNLNNIRALLPLGMSKKLISVLFIFGLLFLTWTLLHFNPSLPPKTIKSSVQQEAVLPTSITTAIPKLNTQQLEETNKFVDQDPLDLLFMDDSKNLKNRKFKNQLSSFLNSPDIPTRARAIFLLSMLPSENHRDALDLLRRISKRFPKNAEIDIELQGTILVISTGNDQVNARKFLQQFITKKENRDELKHRAFERMSFIPNEKQRLTDFSEQLINNPELSPKVKFLAQQYLCTNYPDKGFCPL
jgi:hypothetical protein